MHVAANSACWTCTDRESFTPPSSFSNDEVFLMLDFLCVHRRTIAFVAACVFAFGPSTVAAQSVVDPSAFEFAASADHNATNSDGSPRLSQYEAQFFLPGAAQPFQTASLGKPTPGAGGVIRVSFSSLSARPSPGIVSEARVAALGPGGAAASNVSDSFMFSPAPPPPPPATCSYPLSPTVQAVPSSGGLASVTVNAGGGCAWTASSSEPWLHIGNGSGTGFGYVLATADPNTGSTTRTAVLRVNGTEATVTQPAASSTACTFDIAPSAPSLGSGEASGSLSVSTAATCGWSATSTTNWITITATTGIGAGWVSYRVSANAGSAARTGTMMVAGQSLTVTQAGSGDPVPTGCDVAVATTSLLAPATATTDSVGVTAAAGCSWAATSSVDWLTITATTGSGTGWVSYNLAPNTGPQSRTGVITLGDERVTVTQVSAQLPGGQMPSAPRGFRILTP